MHGISHRRAIARRMVQLRHDKRTNAAGLPDARRGRAHSRRLLRASLGVRGTLPGNAVDSTRSPILSHRVRVVGSNRIVILTYVWQGWRTHAREAQHRTHIRDARRQASQICIRLSTAQRTLLVLLGNFSPTTCFLSRNSDGRSATPLQRHDHGRWDGKVRVIGCTGDRCVKVCTIGPEHEREKREVLCTTSIRQELDDGNGWQPSGS